MIFVDKTFIKGYFKNNVFLNANTIKDKPQKLVIGRPEIESRSYNLPVIPRIGYKSPKGLRDSSLLEEIIEHNTISQDGNEQNKSTAELKNNDTSFHTTPLVSSVRKLSSLVISDQF